MILVGRKPVSTTPQLQTGTIKAFAIANKTRLATLPTVPTFAEAELQSFELAVWHGLYAPMVQRFASLGTADQESWRLRRPESGLHRQDLKVRICTRNNDESAH